MMIKHETLNSSGLGTWFIDLLFRKQTAKC